MAMLVRKPRTESVRRPQMVPWRTVTAAVDTVIRHADATYIQRYLKMMAGDTVRAVGFERARRGGQASMFFFLFFFEPSEISTRSRNAHVL